MIQPKHGRIVQASCDFDRHGGGWTLLAKSSGPNGWTNDNALNRNSKQATEAQYSIFELVDALKGNDAGEESFDYMVEADGDDQNGGIFSFSLSESLLSSSSGLKSPTLIKKFGNWDEKVENIAKYAIRHVSNGDIDILLAANSGKSVDNSGTIIAGKAGTGVYMTSMKNPKSVKVWIREGGSRKSCNDLKIHGYHNNKFDYKDGKYMMKNSMPVYCDMTTTDKEGWTLLVTAANKGWTFDQVKKRNTAHPSIFTDYSILGKADTIKSLSHGNFFKYMLDANDRRHWGGIWKAPIEYSFTSSSSGLRNVELLTQFDVWNYNKVWFRAPCKRMPYLSSPDNHLALLTTADYPNYAEYGTIISEKSTSDPSKWITYTMQNPGVIWYWVNENDCDADYKKVHGGYSVSIWSSCSALCGEGVQFRIRKCNKPFPRCGGDQCDPSLKLREERSCTGPCPASQIRTPDSKFCLQPKSGGCNAADGTDIVFRISDTCKGDESIFVFNPSKGEIIHKCSKKHICFPNGRKGEKLVINSKCPSPTSTKHFLRTQFHSIFYRSMAWTPSSYKIFDGNTIVLWGNGMNEVEKFVFTNEFYLHQKTGGTESCPDTYHYAYLGGAYCCKYDREKIYAGDGDLCDGSKIGISSKCCKDNQYTKCISPPCTNYVSELCHLKSGDGVGGTEIIVGSISKKNCFAECLSRKESEPEINGITTLASGKDGCWCQKNMERWNNDEKFESCIFVAEIEGYKYGHVNASFFKSVTSFSKLEDKNNPIKATSTGFTDELATPYNFADSYSIILKSYFKAPENGYYTFMAACDDTCKVYLSNSTDESKKNKIIETTRWTSYYQFNKYSNQKSKRIRLEVGMQYYIEAMVREVGGGDHMAIGVILPDERRLEPITYDYLSNFVENIP